MSDALDFHRIADGCTVAEPHYHRDEDGAVVVIRSSPRSDDRYAGASTPETSRSGLVQADPYAGRWRP